MISKIWDQFVFVSCIILYVILGLYVGALFGVNDGFAALIYLVLWCYGVPVILALLLLPMFDIKTVVFVYDKEKNILGFELRNWIERKYLKNE